MSSTADKLRERLARDLQAAMKARDAARASALRSLAAALDNATAVPMPDRADPAFRATGDVPRRVLTDEDVRGVLLREIGERRDAAFVLERHGCIEEAMAIRAEIEVLEGYAPPQDA